MVALTHYLSVFMVFGVSLSPYSVLAIVPVPVLINEPTDLNMTSDELSTLLMSSTVSPSLKQMLNTSRPYDFSAVMQTPQLQHSDIMSSMSITPSLMSDKTTTELPVAVFSTSNIMESPFTHTSSKLFSSDSSVEYATLMISGIQSSLTGYGFDTSEQVTEVSSSLENIESTPKVLSSELPSSSVIHVIDIFPSTTSEIHSSTISIMQSFSTATTSFTMASETFYTEIATSPPSAIPSGTSILNTLSVSSSETILSSYMDPQNTYSIEASSGGVMGTGASSSRLSSVMTSSTLSVYSTSSMSSSMIYTPTLSLNSSDSSLTTSTISEDTTTTLPSMTFTTETSSSDFPDTFPQTPSLSSTFVITSSTMPPYTSTMEPSLSELPDTIPQSSYSTSMVSSYTMSSSTSTIVTSSSDFTSPPSSYSMSLSSTIVLPSTSPMETSSSLSTTALPTSAYPSSMTSSSDMPSSKSTMQTYMPTSVLPTSSIFVSSTVTPSSIVSVTTPGFGVKTFIVHFVLEIPWLENYEEPTSDDYSVLNSEIKTGLERTFSDVGFREIFPCNFTEDDGVRGACHFDLSATPERTAAELTDLYKDILMIQGHNVKQGTFEITDSSLPTTATPTTIPVTPSPSPTEIVFIVTFKMESVHYPYSPQLEDSTSEEYGLFTSIILEMVLPVYYQFSGFIEMRNFAYSPGSVVVQYEAAFNKSSNVTASDVKAANKNWAEIDNVLKVDPESITVVGPDTSSTSSTTSTTMTTQRTTTEGTGGVMPAWAIAVIVVACVLLLVFIILIIVFACKLRSYGTYALPPTAAREGNAERAYREEHDYPAKKMEFSNEAYVEDNGAVKE